MNKQDWYFRQIVTQAVMDMVFDWAEQADHDQSADNVLTGIMDGLEVTENHLGADLSVDIAGGVGFSAEGARIYIPDLVTNLDCSVDEYGVSTTVGTGGNERWLSVFARFTRDLQDPELDGNGLEVYTKQLESFELVVHQGAEDTIGLATKPALLNNAVLLADINLVNGQTTITTATHIKVDRRQDWIRVEGTSLPDFVYGNARDAVEYLYTVIDEWDDTGVPFSFTSTWQLGVPVKGVTYPPDYPATVFEALNAIVYDLQENVGASGASRVGILGYIAPFSYVSWPASSIEYAMILMADDLDGHINGSAPQHPASAITTVADDAWSWMKISDPSAFSPGTITNEDSNQATLVDIINSDKGAWCLIKNKVGTGWSADHGVCMGGSYSTPPDAWQLDGDIDLADLLEGSDLQTVLENMVNQINRLPDPYNEQVAVNRRVFSAEVVMNQATVANSLTGGAGNYKGPMDALETAPPADGDLGKWPLAFENVIQETGNNNFVDICRGWDYRRSSFSVFVVGDDPEVVMFYPLFYSSDFARDARLRMTTDTSGTLLASPATPVAVCCNGPQLFVLVDPDGDGSDAVLYAYDTRYANDNQKLDFLWSTALPKAIGTRKADSRIVCTDTYVWILFGNEDLNTGTPLGRVNASDGGGVIYGAGDGTALGSPVKPKGGLAVVGGATPAVFFTGGNVGGGTLVPADWDLTSTGKGEALGSGIEGREVIVAGRYIIVPWFHYGGSGSNAWVELEYWDWVDDVKGNFFRITNPTGILYDYVMGTFDGMTIWIKFCRGDDADEHHMLVGINPSQFVPGRTIEVTADDRYLVSEPNDGGTDYGDPMGRFVAWGPGLWHIPFEADDHEIYFQPGAGLFFK